MEFPDLGKRCSYSHCEQLDFIPLKCLCGEFFCKIHFISHCQSDHCKYYSKLTNKPTFSDSSPLYKCSSNNCPTSSYIEMPCPKCGKHFCIQHRFHQECPEIDPEILKIEKEKWDKPREEFKTAKALVDAEVTKKLRSMQKSSSKAATALKIQLMKLKQKAKGEGNIPTDDRIYFAVLKPSTCEAKVLTSDVISEHNVPTSIASNLDNPVYISKQWSLGRAIDSISKTLSIKNQNDKTNEPKLRMFRDTDKMCVSINKMDLKMSEIMDRELLLSGETVIFEYISPSDAIAIDDENRAMFLQIS